MKKYSSILYLSIRKKPEEKSKTQKEKGRIFFRKFYIERT